jgi:hypothetical protein
MTDLWPWLAVAGLGALHGANPATGWMFAAACGLHARDGAQARRALIPIAFGHTASITIVAWAAIRGLSMDRTLLRDLAGMLLIGVALIHLVRGARRRRNLDLRADHAAMALWSFLTGTIHGTGLMLVPALAPLCVANGGASAITASGSLVLAIAAVAVHATAMLIAAGGIASAVCRGAAMGPRLLHGTVPRQAWTAMLGATGVLLVVLS